MSEQLIKILGIILLAAVSCILLRTYRPEFSFAVCLAAAATVLIFVLNSVFPAVENIKNTLSSVKSASAYFKIALKALGIAYITGLSADICRDFGQSALASKAEFAGKCVIFVLSVPLIGSILDAVSDFANI